MVRSGTALRPRCAPGEKYASSSVVGARPSEPIRLSMSQDHEEEESPPASEMLPMGMLSVDPLPRAEGARAEVCFTAARLADAIDSGDATLERKLSIELARKFAVRGTDLDEALRLAGRALEIADDPALGSELSGWLGGVGEPALAAEELERVASSAKTARARARAFMRAAVLRARSADAIAARDDLARAAECDKKDAIPYELAGTLSSWSDLPAEEAALAYLEAAARRDAAGDEEAAFEDRLRAFEASRSSAVAAEALIARGRL
jgi:hypothetical protein